MAQLYNASVANAATVQTAGLNCTGALGASFLFDLDAAMSITFQASDDGVNWYTFDSSWANNGPAMATFAATAGNHAVTVLVHGLPLIRAQINNASGGAANATVYGYRDGAGTRR
jgi:hypothetical protein